MRASVRHTVLFVIMLCTASCLLPVPAVAADWLDELTAVLMNHRQFAKLNAAEHPLRDFIVGGAVNAMLLGQNLAPSLMDRLLAWDRFGFQTQQTDERKSLDAPDDFYTPAESENRSEGDFSPKARGYSVYDWLEMRGGAGTFVLPGAVGAAALLAARKLTAPRASSAR